MITINSFNINGKEIEISDDTLINQYNKLKYRAQTDERYIFNNVGIVGNWRLVNRNGTMTLSTYVSGAELLFKIKGTETVKINCYITDNIMNVVCNVDDGDFISKSVISETTIAENLDTDYWHVICIRTAFSNLSSDSFHTLDGCFNFISLVVDDGATVVPLTVSNRKILFIGDSITAGASLNVYEGYMYKLSTELNAQQISSALSGAGLLHGSRTYLPNSREMFERLFDETSSISIINEPDIAFIMIGTNDGSSSTAAEFQAEYENLLMAIRNRFGGIPIFACAAFNGTHVSDSLAATKKFDNVFHIDTTNLKGTYSTVDGTHPDATGSLTCVNYILPYIFNAISKQYFNNI